MVPRPATTTLTAARTYTDGSVMLSSAVSVRGGEGGGGGGGG